MTHGAAPQQPTFQLGLFQPQPPLRVAAKAKALHELVAQDAVPAPVMAVADCRARYAWLSALRVEFTQEPIARYGNVDANFQDPSGN